VGSGLMPSPGEVLTDGLLERGASGSPKCALGIAKRVRRRMDRELPQDEIVLGRAENELSVIIVQACDAVIGTTIKDRMKTFGPAGTALLNLVAVIWLIQAVP
jgi:hypothetical protein